MPTGEKARGVHCIGLGEISKPSWSHFQIAARGLSDSSGLLVCIKMQRPTDSADLGQGFATSTFICNVHGLRFAARL